MGIHPTSIISPRARLGTNVSVGPYAIIEADTQIGADTEIRAHAVIKRFTSLGDDNIVHEGAVLGGEPQDTGFVDCESYLRIGSHNHIREGVTVHRATQPNSETIVGSNCFLMSNSHVGHNSRLGDGVIIASNVAVAGHVEIQDQAFISGGVVIHQFCKVGRLAMIGGNSKIVQDCLPFVVTDGLPGRACGLNKVGLKRAGVDSNTMQNLKQAYRLLLRSKLSLEAALEEIDGISDPMVQFLSEFIRSSTRGFCHD